MYWTAVLIHKLCCIKKLNVSPGKTMMVLFIVLYKVVHTLTSVNETLVCDHSKESYWKVPSCGNVYSSVLDGSCLNM